MQAVLIFQVKIWESLLLGMFLMSAKTSQPHTFLFQSQALFSKLGGLVAMIQKSTKYSHSPAAWTTSPSVVVILELPARAASGSEIIKRS